MGDEQDVMVPWIRKGDKGKKEKAKKKQKEEVEIEQPKEECRAALVQEEKTFLRYYHLYKKGELEHNIIEAGGQVVESGYEKDNWWAIAVLKGPD